MVSLEVLYENGIGICKKLFPATHLSIHWQNKPSSLKMSLLISVTLNDNKILPILLQSYSLVRVFSLNYQKEFLGLGCGSSSRVPAQQVQDPEFKL
jgi:hypothetical protein